MALVTGQFIQKFLNYTGQSHDTHEGVPEGVLPQYTPFGSVGLIDNQSLARALASASAAKRIEMSGATAQSVGSLPSLVLSSNNTYPALITASVSRSYPKNVVLNTSTLKPEYAVIRDFWFLDIAVGLFHEMYVVPGTSTSGNPAGSVSVDTNFTLWNKSRAKFTLRHNGSPIASRGLSDPEGNLSLAGVVNLTNSTDTFTLTYDGGGPRGTLHTSTINCIGLNNF